MLYFIIRYKIRSEILIVASLFLRFIVPYLPNYIFTGGEISVYTGTYSKYLDIPDGLNSFIRTISSYLLGIGIVSFRSIRMKKNSYFIYILVILFIGLLFIEKGLFLIPLLSALMIKHLYEDGQNLVKSFLETKAVYLLGNISYSLYIIHYIVRKQYFGIVDSIFINNLLLISLSLVLSYFSYILIERKVKIFKV